VKNAERPTRLERIPQRAFLRTRDLEVMGDINLNAASAGQSREGLLDDMAERLDVESDQDLVEWYGPRECDPSTLRARRGA
jgi:hypothetical protein